MHRNRVAVALARCLLLLTVGSQWSDGMPLQFCERVPIVDTLEVLLQGASAGMLVASLSQSGDTTVNRIVLTVEMADQSGAGRQRLELEEQRTYLHGVLRAAHQRMSGAAGVNSWVLTASTPDSAIISVTAAGQTTQRNIGPVHESIVGLAQLYTGIFSNSLQKGDRWLDTSVELTSGESVISETKCVELPSDSNDSCWVFVCTNDLLQRREVWKLDRRGATVYRDIYPYTGRKKSGTPEVSGGIPGGTSLFDMMKIRAERPAAPDREIVAVSFDNNRAVDTSVASFFRRQGTTYLLEPLSRKCENGKTLLPAAKRARFLAPTATLQCRHPAIKRLADSLYAAGGSTCELVGRYNHWVYTTLRKKSSPTFSSALETLNAGYGDCGEHAVLLAALLRASGIPARVVDGLIYVATDKGYFYHAWVVAYTGTWVFADPSHDCFPAWRDRIPLVIDDDGSRLTALAKVIGRTSVAYIGKGKRH